MLRLREQKWEKRPGTLLECYSLPAFMRAMRACRNGQGIFAHVKHTRIASCSHQIQQVISFSKTKPNAIWKLKSALTLQRRWLWSHKLPSEAKEYTPSRWGSAEQAERSGDWSPLKNDAYKRSCLSASDNFCTNYTRETIYRNTTLKILVQNWLSAQISAQLVQHIGRSS